MHLSVYCLLCCVLRAACRVLRAACCVLRAACCVLHAACCMLRATCCVLRATYYVLRATSIYPNLAAQVLIYLEGHADDDDAITIVPGSFASPSMDTQSAITLHPPKGSVIIFEQRSTHRGRMSVLRGASMRGFRHHQSQVRILSPYG